MPKSNNIEAQLKQVSESIVPNPQWVQKERADFLKMAEFYVHASATPRTLPQKLKSFWDDMLNPRRTRIALLSLLLVIIGLVSFVFFYTPARLTNHTTKNSADNQDVPVTAVSSNDALHALSNTKEYLTVAKGSEINVADSDKILAEAQTAYDHKDYKQAYTLCEKINRFLDQFVMAGKPVYLEKDNRVTPTQKADVQADHHNDNTTPAEPQDPGIAHITPTGN
jgi:hypothetical protein